MRRQNRITLTVGVLLLIGILSQVLFDPLSSIKHDLEISRVQHDVPQAHAKWEARNVRNYSFEIQGGTPLICLVNARIEVKNDAVISVKTMSSQGPQPLSPYQWSDPDWGDEVFLCNYNNFTMTRIFHLVDETLHTDSSIILGADFDPAYGFITHYRYGLFIPNGLLSPRISDCCSEFRISHFEPLQP